MLVEPQVRCLADHFDFSDKKVLVVGRMSADAILAMGAAGALVNHLNPDVVVYWGLLSKMNTELHLEYASKRCAALILECEVLDTRQNMCTKTASKVKPSAAYVESMLRRLGFQPEMIMDERLNIGHRNYTWPVKETWQCKHTMRRVWVARRVPTHDTISFP